MSSNEISNPMRIFGSCQSHPIGYALPSLFLKELTHNELTPPCEISLIVCHILQNQTILECRVIKKKKNKKIKNVVVKKKEKKERKKV